MTYLTAEDLLFIHHQLIETFGGSHGLRDSGRLQAVAAAAEQSLFGVEQYPTVFDKAAVYARNIIGDHPFVDGNKRTGITAAVMFLDKSNVKLKFRPHELEDYAVRIATDHLKIIVIARWLKAHATPSQKS